MTKARPATPRTHKLLERVYQALGASQIRERWINDRHGVQGLAEPGVITISPLALVETIIHEALHRAQPTWSETSIDRTTTYIYSRLTDDDCKRLWTAYAAKVKRMRRPTTAE